MKKNEVRNNRLMLGGLITAGAAAGSLLTWLLVFLIFKSSFPSNEGLITNTHEVTNGPVQTITETITELTQETTSANTEKPSPSENEEQTQPGEQEPDLSEQSERRISWIARKVLPSIAGIRVEAYLPGTSFFTISEGSGVIYSADGYIVTNNHVIESVYDGSGNISEEARVYVYLHEDKQQYEASIVGRDSATDLALLKINKRDLQPAEFGDSELLETGELAVAIGSPSGLQLMGSVTAGIISGLDRQVQLESGTSMTLIQTDAAVNTGNSGGALINEHGQIIGINNAGLVKSQFEGINFAIPANTVTDVINELKLRPIPAGQPWLGVAVMSDEEYREKAELYNWPEYAVYIYDIQQDSPAQQAGLKSGDIITGFNGSTVINTSDFSNQLQRFYPGQRIVIEIFRSETGEELSVNAILGETLS